MVDNYTLSCEAKAKESRNRSKSNTSIYENRYTGYINSLHYLSMQNQDILLAFRLFLHSNRYFAFQESPIFLSETQSGDPLVNFIIS
jgi:hypothetical protein